MIQSERLKSTIINFFIVLFFCGTLVSNLYIHNEQQFTYLSQAFVQGKAYFLEKPGTWMDTVKFEEKVYWPNAPLPAILLMPFTLILNLVGGVAYQGFLNIALTWGVFVLCYKLAIKLGFNKTDSKILAFAFCFSTVFTMIAFIPWSWYFAQTITVFFALLAINEYFGKKRMWVIGTIFALVFLTRFTAGLGILFFVLDVITTNSVNLKDKLKKLAMLVIPIILAGLLLLAYNQMRF